MHNSKEQFDNAQGPLARADSATTAGTHWPRRQDVRTLTDAVVEAGLRSQDVVGGEVNDVAGEAELAADGGFWPQQGKSFDLGGRAGSCGGWRISATSSQTFHNIKGKVGLLKLTLKPKG